jgi:hypothetical protein
MSYLLKPNHSLVFSIGVIGGSGKRTDGIMPVNSILFPSAHLFPAQPLTVFTNLKTTKFRKAIV